MAVRIKNFKKFQHFKDRTPPWVKLYRDLLDDPDWHELDDRSAKLLVMLWLIASEDESMQGCLPSNRKLCFRLRIGEKELVQALNKLSHWLEHDDISALSPGYQGDAPEVEREEEEISCPPSASEPAVDDSFADFWGAYPRKVSKPNAEKVWRKLKPAGQTLTDLMAGLERQKATEQWRKGDGQFIPHPATWLNGRRWEDELSQQPGEKSAGTAGALKIGERRIRFGIEEEFDPTMGWIPRR